MTNRRCMLQINARLTSNHLKINFLTAYNYFRLPHSFMNDETPIILAEFKAASKTSFLFCPVMLRNEASHFAIQAELCLEPADKFFVRGISLFDTPDASCLSMTNRRFMLRTKPTVRSDISLSIYARV